MPESTQNGGTAATDGATSAASTPDQQGLTSSQPVNGAQVEGVSTEGVNRKSSQSDAGVGGDGDDGDRGREGRAERTIKSLKARIKELETQQGGEDNLTQKLLSTKVDPSKVQLPDYSQMDVVTPQQLQNDIIKAAEQIVDAKMGVLASSLETKITRKESAGSALQEIDAAKKKWKVLDDSDEENYNEELDKSIGNGYYEIFKQNPSYSFADYIKGFEPVLRAAEANASNGAGNGNGNRGTAANRPSTGSRRGQKRIEDMSLDEMENYIHSQAG